MAVMASPPGERTAVLIIRAWIEGEPPSLRMRVTRTFDVAAADETTEATASIEEVCAIVRRWLEQLERSVTGG
jgi:hypothetical protein